MAEVAGTAVGMAKIFNFFDLIYLIPALCAHGCLEDISTLYEEYN